MLVGLERVGDVGVAEPLGHDLHGDAFLDEQAAVGVAQIMKADRWDVGVVDDAPEPLVDGMRVDRFAGAVGEHPLFVVGDANRGEIGGLVGSPACEDGERRRLLAEHGQMARDYPDVRANTVSSFALGDYEWMLAFEAAELYRIVDLMRHLRGSETRRHVREEVPFYTGRRLEPADLINALP